MISLFNILLTLLFAIIMGAGQMVLSLASKDIFSKEVISIGVLIESKWLWVGIAVYAFSMILWIYILSRFDVRYAYPISATAIFFAALFQSIIQRSMPSSSYWFGLVIVFIGLIVLSSDRNG